VDLNYINPLSIKGGKIFEVKSIKLQTNGLSGECKISYLNKKKIDSESSKKERGEDLELALTIGR